MILELAFAPLFLLISFIISLIPQVPVANISDVTKFFDIIGTGLYFFGTDAFSFAIGSLIFWFGVDLGWGVIEWLYKKIPGVD